MCLTTVSSMSKMMEISSTAFYDTRFLEMDRWTSVTSVCIRGAIHVGLSPVTIPGTRCTDHNHFEPAEMNKSRDGRKRY